MNKALGTINAVAAAFSLVWLVGHSTVQVWDWEFWFALGYLILAALNTAYLFSRRAT